MLVLRSQAKATQPQATQPWATPNLKVIVDVDKAAAGQGRLGQGRHEDLFLPLSTPPGLDTTTLHFCNGPDVIDPALGLVGYLLRKDLTVSLGRPSTTPAVGWERTGSGIQMALTCSKLATTGLVSLPDWFSMSACSRSTCPTT